MLIKNTGFSLAGTSGNYLGKKLDKTDFTRSAAESSSSFASQLKTHANPVDKIELSQHAVDNRSTLSQAKNTIISEINQDTNVSRLESLKQQISSKQYSINATEIAKIMLLN